MAASCLRNALFAIALVLTVAVPGYSAPPRPQKATRPEIASMIITLEDGRTYSLKSNELREAKGGAIFWGDWAVSNLLVPSASSSRDPEQTSYKVIQSWWTPGRSGELPAFLVLTPRGPIYPLDPGGPDPSARSFQPAYRPQVRQILVGYQDGRTCTFSELTLRDEKSGIVVWNDFAVETLLIPFYAAGKSTVTSASDVVRTWNTPTTAISSGSTLLAVSEELPGYLVKPRCIPAYPGPE